MSLLFWLAYAVGNCPAQQRVYPARGRFTCIFAFHRNCHNSAVQAYNNQNCVHSVTSILLVSFTKTPPHSMSLVSRDPRPKGVSIGIGSLSCIVFI